MLKIYKSEILYLVALYIFCSINPTLCCEDLIEVSKDKSYATFKLSATAGEIIKAEVVLRVQERLADDNTGRLKLIESANEAQATLEASNSVGYKIVFPRTNVHPRVVQISKNERIICSADRGGPATFITLTHTFTTIGAIDSKPTSSPVTEEIRNEGTPSVSEFPCGQVPIKTSPLAFGGTPLEKSTWPWLAALFHSGRNGTYQFTCGGTIISWKAIVTAAHCFDSSDKEREYNIVVGRHNLRELSEGQTLAVSEILKNTYYRGIQHIDADIAIVKVKKRITFDGLVVPACIWWENTGGINDAIDEQGIVVGWGASEGKTLNDEPIKVEAPIVSRDDCIKRHPKLKNFNALRGFCAGKLDGSGPCTGDSGSGLLVERNDKWWLRGLVSLRIEAESCTEKAYVFYTDVAQFTDWIRQNLV